MQALPPMRAAPTRDAVPCKTNSCDPLELAMNADPLELAINALACSPHLSRSHDRHGWLYIYIYIYM